MELSSNIAALNNMFKNQDWFFDIGTDQFGRIVVYTKYMCHATLHDIPIMFNGHHVLVHFATSKTATRSQYTSEEKKQIPVIELPSSDLIEEENEEFDLPAYSVTSMATLTAELDRLEKICGSNILQDIFYECHDGKNAVTNLSDKFPEVRSSINKLYDLFGFDVIYEELDG